MSDWELGWHRALVDTLDDLIQLSFTHIFEENEKICPIWNINILQITVFIVQCTLYMVLFSVYSPQCKLSTVHYLQLETYWWCILTWISSGWFGSRWGSGRLGSQHTAVYWEQFTLFTVNCAMFTGFSLHNTVRSEQNKLYTPQSLKININKHLHIYICCF